MHNQKTAGEDRPSTRKLQPMLRLLGFVRPYLLQLLAQVLKYMDQGVRPENSYRVEMETDMKTGAERLVWITEIDGREVQLYSEPEAGIGRRFSAWFMGLLPIEKHL